MKSIYEHNFKRDFSEHSNCQRVYALNDEAGLLLCSWPDGGRPRLPFPYADEVWTGIEYQVAAHLIFEGWVDEGLEIVEALRDASRWHSAQPLERSRMRQSLRPQHGELGAAAGAERYAD